MDREAKALFKTPGRVRPGARGILPDVPAARDAGFDIEISTERGFAAHRGVPADIIARLQEAIAAAVIGPEFLHATTSEDMAMVDPSGAGWITSMAARKARYEPSWGAAE